MVDNAMIDQKILIESIPEAQKVMFSMKPFNVREAYTPDGSRLFVAYVVSLVDTYQS
jgi:hypothetical protein